MNPITNANEARRVLRIRLQEQFGQEQAGKDSSTTLEADLRVYTSRLRQIDALSDAEALARAAAPAARS